MYLESETLELRSSIKLLKEGIISLCAMLNKHSKGTLYFGINDNGKVIGMDIGSNTKKDITHNIQTYLKPLPSYINIEELDEEGKTIIKVDVEGKDAPYSAFGRYYIRLNDLDILMNSSETLHFFENKTNTYERWEKEETEFDVNDIDEELLLDCIRTANDKGRLNYIYRNPLEALNKLGLLTENNKLNKTGLYLFGKNKPLTIKEANYPTDSRSEFGEIKEFKGNIIECIKEATSYIQNHISYKSNIIGIQREEFPEIPLRAIREIVINSFAHCSYQVKGDFNQYVVFKSSIKIYNPGPIFKDIDPIKFASGNIGSKIRNLLIANTLYLYGYIDSFGTGFDRTFTLCAENNIDYSYKNDEFGFTFIFHRKKDFLNNEHQKESTIHLDELDLKIIKCIENNKFITINELKEILNKSTPTIQRHLSFLIKINKIERIGSRKKGYWKIIDN